MKAHWTQRTIKDYVFRIAADFIAQLEKKMEIENISQDELARRLKISKGRISQVLNHPGNLSLTIIVKYAKILGMKASIVAYEDGDPEYKEGPVNSELFKICWESCEKPRDFWALQEIEESSSVAANVTDAIKWNETFLEKNEAILCSSSAVVDSHCWERIARQNIDPKQNLDAVGTGPAVNA